MSSLVYTSVHIWEAIKYPCLEVFELSADFCTAQSQLICKVHNFLKIFYASISRISIEIDNAVFEAFSGFELNRTVDSARNTCSEEKLAS